MHRVLAAAHAQVIADEAVDQLMRTAPMLLSATEPELLRKVHRFC